MEERLTTMQQAVREYQLSSRTLRYYEQAGLLNSIRLPGVQQRCYDEVALKRLRQIVVLRKLQIPIKDIQAILDSPDGTAMTEAFLRKLEALDDEIESLTALREVVDAFLAAMLERGVTKASGMELLYQETERRLARRGEDKPAPITAERVAEASQRARRLGDVSILRLPPMRVLTSQFLADGRYDDFEEARLAFAQYGVEAQPGMRQGFYIQLEGGEWAYCARVEDSFINRTPYLEGALPGGLYAVALSYIDEFPQVFSLLREWVEKSDAFVMDRDAQGRLARMELLEEMYPWDVVERLGRYQQNLYVPIRWKER